MNLAAERAGALAGMVGGPRQRDSARLVTLADAVVSMRSRSRARRAVDEALAGAWGDES